MTSHEAMRLRRAAVAIAAVKGFICGAIGGAALAYSLLARGPQVGFLAFGLFVLSLPVLLAAITYFLAAFLLARAPKAWRVSGALMDTAASLAVSWALVEEGTVLDRMDSPLSIVLFAIAATWVGASLPGLVAAFRRTSIGVERSDSPTGSVGSAQR